ncbi:natural resistance-associated macrophage protein 2 isoform X2 [Octopus sinensis]|uniref:Natural resistance-associated macrophage protein 2 isoform X2 n=1 Tax=Octopus sinensis TaxID=2607531 RepID=A0A6P7T7S8_9MOLL|nr:natural resistance-associated macrophage protein 2 isoform X2 [Octopus sinensis]
MLSTSSEHVFVNKTQIWQISCEETSDTKEQVNNCSHFDNQYQQINSSREEDVTPSDEGDTDLPRRFSFRKLWAFTGPGFLMSIAYLDPGNIESDLQTGVIVKYKLLWMLFWSTFMGLILQLLAARLGSVTGENLAQVCRKEYPKFPRLLLWIMIELAIIGSDIQEVIGSAIAINLLSNGLVPIWGGVLITGLDTFTFLFLENAGLRILEGFFGLLISIMAVCFMYLFIIIKPDFVEIMKGLAIPWCKDCSRDGIQQMAGIIGAVVMPHNIYLHSALVLSRSVDRTDKRNIKEANMYYTIESSLALFLSFIINMFVVTVFAAANLPDGTDTLAKAGTWLATHFNMPALKIIWAVGVLASGQSSTMTGTYTGQFVMEGFLNIRWPKWQRVLMTRSIAMVPTILVALLAQKFLDPLNTWLNVLQSVELPFALFPILHFTSSLKIMNDFKNGRILQGVVWFLAILDIGVNIYLISFYINSESPWYVYLITAIVGLLYFMFVLYLGIGRKNCLKLKIFVLRCLRRISDLPAFEREEQIAYEILEEQY